MTHILEAKLFIFDTESTDRYPETAKIVELGALIVEGGQIKKMMCSFVHPGGPIPPDATNIHGISDEMVAGCETMATMGPRINNLLENSGFDAVSGYNIIGYDVPLLAREIGISLAYSAGHILNSALDPLLFVRHGLRHLHGRKLGDMCERAGVVIGDGVPAGKFGRGAHSALADAKATWDLTKRLVMAGHMPSDLMVALEAQYGLQALQDYEDAAYTWHLYHDRNHPKIARGLPAGIGRDDAAEYLADVPLIVGFGKTTIGVPLDKIARTDRRFLSWALNKNDLPPAVKTAFETCLGR